MDDLTKRVLDQINKARTIIGAPNLEDMPKGKLNACQCPVAQAPTFGALVTVVNAHEVLIDSNVSPSDRSPEYVTSLDLLRESVATAWMTSVIYDKRVPHQGNIKTTPEIECWIDTFDRKGFPEYLVHSRPFV